MKNLLLSILYWLQDLIRFWVWKLEGSEKNQFLVELKPGMKIKPPALGIKDVEYKNE